MLSGTLNTNACLLHNQPHTTNPQEAILRHLPVGYLWVALVPNPISPDADQGNSKKSALKPKQLMLQSNSRTVCPTFTTARPPIPSSSEKKQPTGGIKEKKKKKAHHEDV